MSPASSSISASSSSSGSAAASRIDRPVSPKVMRVGDGGHGVGAQSARQAPHAVAQAQPVARVGQHVLLHDGCALGVGRGSRTSPREKAS